MVGQWDGRTKYIFIMKSVTRGVLCKNSTQFNEQMRWLLHHQNVFMHDNILGDTVQYTNKYCIAHVTLNECTESHS